MGTNFRIGKLPDELHEDPFCARTGSPQLAEATRPIATRAAAVGRRPAGSVFRRRECGLAAGG